MMAIIYLNGQYLPQKDAKISVLDRGFLFGDGVYEVVPVYNGHIIGLTQHLDRLKISLELIHMTAPLSKKQWQNVFDTLLEKNDKLQGTHGIYLQVTRGDETTRSHAIPTNYQPTVVAFMVESKARQGKELSNGFSAITLDDTRRRDCNIKAITLLPNILLYEEARRANASEAILIRNGEALEGTSSNLFIVKDQTILTPPLNSYILGGVTRELIIHLANANNLPLNEKTITEQMLHDADEIWLTGSSKEILPITTLNEKPVGTGKAGPVWQRMFEHYETYKGQR
jgi:D-alanine transaminase